MLATFVVNNFFDLDGGGDVVTGSLRNAVEEANATVGRDTIMFADFLFDNVIGSTINLDGRDNGGPLLLTDIAGVDIIGPGPAMIDGLTEEEVPGRLTINAAGNNRIFFINDGNDEVTSRVTISGVTLAGGSPQPDDEDGLGGAILNVENLTLSEVELRNNFAPSGGGAVHNSTGVLRIENSLVRDNTSLTGGGGIQTGEPDQDDDLPTTTIVNSTITGNTAIGVPVDDSPTGYGGGVYNRAGTTNIEQSTIYGNEASVYGGGVASRGFDPEADDMGMPTAMGGSSTTNIRSSIIVGNTAQMAPDDVGNAGMTDDDPPLPFEPQINSLGYNIFGVLSHPGMTSNPNIILPPGGTNDVVGADPTNIFIDNPAAMMPEAWLNDFGGILPVFMPDINKTDPMVGANLAIDRGDPDPMNVVGDFGQRGFAFARTADVTGMAMTPIIDIGAAELQVGNFVVNTVVDESDGRYAPVPVSVGVFPLNALTFVPDLSLREALELAEKNLATGVTATNVISFSQNLANKLANPDPLASTDAQTIQLTEGELVVTVPVNIAGPTTFELEIDASGNDPLPGVPGGGGSRVFSILETTAISDLILRGGDSQEFGGAILSSADLTLLNTTITENFTTGDGGGIYIAGGTVLIDSSTVYDNGAAISGGGIFVAAGNLTLRSSTVSGNTGTFVGGGVANYDGAVRIEYSTITNNTASSTFGSGIVSYRDGTATTEVRSSIISGNTINDVQHFRAGTDNIVSLGYNLVGDGNAVLTGAFAAPGDQTFADAMLAPLARLGGPTPVHRLLPGSPAVDAGDPNAGGLGNVPGFDQRGFPFERIENGVRIDIGSFEVQDNILFIGDLATDPAAGFSTFFAALEESNLTPTTETIVFLPSWLGEDFPDDLLVSDSVQIVGGNNGFRFFNTNIIVDDENDEALIDVSIDSLRFDSGTHIDSSENLTLTNMQFVDNVPEPNALEIIDGGAISHRVGKLTIVDSNFIGNSSERHGGAIFVDTGELEINNSFISGSSTGATDGSGGAIYIKDGTFTADNLYLTGNVAPGATGMGGALYAKNSTVTLNNAIVSGNSTAGSNSDGGAIAGINSNVTITGSAVSFNTTVGTQSSGGAIYVDGGTLTIQDTGLALNSTFGQDSSGGAVAATNADVTISSSSLNSNETSGFASHGGSIFSSGGNLEVRDSSVTNSAANQAGSNGGGIFTQKDFTGSDKALIINSTISGNYAANRGGGIYNAGGLLQIKYSTITDNSVPYFGAGGGVASYGSTFSTMTEVGSSIISSNHTLNDPVNLFSDVESVEGAVNSFSSLGYNIIGNGVQFTLDAFNAAGDQVGVVDPGLTELSFDISSGTFFHDIASDQSPAVNAGDPNADAGIGDVPEFDQRGAGFTRVFSSVRIDAGAIESAFGPLTPLVAGPDFDGDGDVDGSDFLAWQRGFGTTTGAMTADGDANSDGAVDGLDFGIWSMEYGTSGDEPSGVALAAASAPTSEPLVAAAVLVSDDSPAVGLQALPSVLVAEVADIGSSIAEDEAVEAHIAAEAVAAVRDDAFAGLSHRSDYRGGADSVIETPSDENDELEVAVEDMVFDWLGA
ncbi:MAG: choice-of-anchor Q domain-containing protein [Planctomycetota bacterium]